MSGHDWRLCRDFWVSGMLHQMLLDPLQSLRHQGRDMIETHSLARL